MGVGIMKAPCYPIMEMGRRGGLPTIHKTGRWYDMLAYNSAHPQLLVPISRPSSYDVLPPIEMPSQSEVIRVERIRQSLIKECGIKPGTYSELDRGIYPRLEAVYDGLVSSLLEELSDVDAFDLSIRLYERHEEYFGYLFRAHFDLGARRQLLGSSESPMRNEWLWERLSPYTESLRWLIEIALKHCNMQGERAGTAKFNRLIELARAIYEWDLVWEQIFRHVTRHELVIGSDFGVTPQLTPRTVRVRNEYHRALMPSMEDGEKEEFERYQNQEYKMTPDEACQKTKESLESMGLDEALMEERGYTLSDWGRFSLGLLDSFSSNEYRKVVKLSTLESHLSRKWHLDGQRIPSLLRDYSLSKETVGDIDMKKLRPVEFGRRDSRLLRRPVVILKRGDSVRCLYGVETISRGHILVLERLESGRIDLVRQSGRNLTKAVGRLQKELGRVFEQSLADECKVRGYDYRLEVKGVKGKRIPQGSGFGPVDVFVVDRTHRRFVLVEAKNVADEGSLPKEMQSERKEFSKFISKLNLQVEWFAQQLTDLKSEHGLPDDEDYSIEGVIVANSPRLWMFTYDRPVPILDFFNFFRCLEQGRRFAIDPVMA